MKRQESEQNENGEKWSKKNEEWWSCGWVEEEKSIFNIWPGLGCLGRQDGDKDLKAMKDISGKSVSGRWNFEKIEEEEHSWFMQATEMSPFWLGQSEQGSREEGGPQEYRGKWQKTEILGVLTSCLPTPFWPLRQLDNSIITQITRALKCKLCPGNAIDLKGHRHRSWAGETGSHGTR